eukprot:CAMPEP_0177536172 /NCGR_PEP_ID=MMETSP0369-20130122/57017_1 /TAXON_ID=447022 ORGANISM="Scrippsiella hangoei-like, Strain SHHI-4" /NCGR_SAMPLE_ID=MMETSP0369 /ASSEMBLY_ACC=CAM_ASM_000364 /LENGTH=74 /DNA_ID=CAMNT_0019018529 /DNA_START=205 /DNA_END=430 /DNA_ORIENTATION=-
MSLYSAPVLSTFVLRANDNVRPDAAVALFGFIIDGLFCAHWHFRQGHSSQPTVASVMVGRLPSGCATGATLGII